MQARVFELVHAEGRPTGKVIKIAHVDLGHKALNAVWISMEREWELGLKLRAALQLPDGRLPGFMRVCGAVVSRNGGKHAHFAGMILEKLNGWEIYKRIGKRAEICSLARLFNSNGESDHFCRGPPLQSAPSSTTSTTCARCCGRCSRPWTGRSARPGSSTPTWACAT
jgi:hypothetical protein